MAVQIETQGQLAEFLEILGRRRWQFLLPAALLLSVGVALAVFIPKKFLVATQVEVRPVGLSTSGKEAENAPNQIRAVERIRKVVEQLKNPAYLALPDEKKYEFLTDLRDDLKVKTDKPLGATSTFLLIEYTHVSIQWAMLFLKALRDDWKRDVIDRDQNTANDEERRANEEVAALEAASKLKESELSRLYKQNNISPTQPIPGGTEQRNEDPEYERLQRNKDELDKTTFALAGAELSVTSLQKQLDDSPERLSEQQVLEGVSNSSEILDLELKISEQNNELARYNPSHTKYGLILKKIKELEDKRDAIKRLNTRGELTSLQKLNPQHVELQRQVEAARLERDRLQAKKQALEATIQQDTQNVGQLYIVYNEITRLSKETRLLGVQLEAATLKRDEKVRQARAFASRLNDPFSVTQEVQAPQKPTEPNPWLIVAFSLVAGLILGLSITLSAEYGRNCFRSVHDVSRVMVAPVLGSVGSIQTSHQRRMRSLRRTLVGSLSAALIVGLLFVTWAWASNPQLLSPQLRARIEQMRAKLR